MGRRTTFKDDDLHTQITVSAANLDLTKEIKICDTQRTHKKAYETLEISVASGVEDVRTKNKNKNPKAQT